MVDYLQEQMEAVLYVDNDQARLNNFKTTYRKQLNVFTSTNAVEGLKMLKKHKEIKVIVSEQRLPDISGVEFFDKIRSLYPNKVRIIISNFSDIQEVLDAINKGQVYKYILKPWCSDKVLEAIQEGVMFFDSKMKVIEETKILQDTNSHLGEMVSKVSHDLRSPLMSILGIANLAELDVEDPKSIEYFQSIKSMVGKLDSQIHQLIQKKKRVEEKELSEIIDFELIINEILDSIKFHPSAQKVDFKLNIEKGLTFRSNLVKIKAILNNLISNAFKYQREEEFVKWVMINVKLIEKEVNIVIQDNGKGIKPEEVEKVFEKYYRSNNDEKGTGLGLFIVKETIEKLGGNISLESTFGEGTKVTVSLPDAT